jgi:hypothetical protein
MCCSISISFNKHTFPSWEVETIMKKVRDKTPQLGLAIILPMDRIGRRKFWSVLYYKIETFM